MEKGKVNVEIGFDAERVIEDFKENIKQSGIIIDKDLKIGDFVVNSHDGIMSITWTGPNGNTITSGFRLGDYITIKDAKEKYHDN